MARAHARIRTSTSGRNNHPSACAIEAVAWKRPMPSKADAGALYSSIRVTAQNTQLHQSASTRASATLATPNGSLPLPRYAGAFLIRPRVPSWAFQGISFQQSGGWNPCRAQVCIRCSPYWTFTPWRCSHSETDVHHRKEGPGPHRRRCRLHKRDEAWGHQPSRDLPVQPCAQRLSNMPCRLSITIQRNGEIHPSVCFFQCRDNRIQFSGLSAQAATPWSSNSVHSVASRNTAAGRPMK